MQYTVVVVVCVRSVTERVGIPGPYGEKKRTNLEGVRVLTFCNSIDCLMGTLA